MQNKIQANVGKTSLILSLVSEQFIDEVLNLKKNPTSNQKVKFIYYFQERWPRFWASNQTRTDYNTSWRYFFYFYKTRLKYEIWFKLLKSHTRENTRGNCRLFFERTNRTGVGKRDRESERSMSSLRCQRPSIEGKTVHLLASQNHRDRGLALGCLAFR